MLFRSLWLLKRANSTGAPANRPGFLLFNRLEDILPKADPIKSTLLNTFRPTNAIKMDLHDLDSSEDAGMHYLFIYDLDYAVRQYCNQEPFQAIDCIRGRAPLMITSPITGLPVPMEEPEEAPAIECHSVLKWRKRKMRGHKHKKRLRKNRYKTK